MKDDTIRAIVKENANIYRDALTPGKPENKGGEIPFYPGMTAWIAGFSCGNYGKGAITLPGWVPVEGSITSVCEATRTVTLVCPKMHKPIVTRPEDEVFRTREGAAGLCCILHTRMARQANEALGIQSGITSELSS